MKLADWYKNTPKQMVIRFVVVLALLTGLLFFRRGHLTREEAGWILLAALMMLFVAAFNFFGKRAAEKDAREHDGNE